MARLVATALERFGLGGLKSALAPLIIVFLATPVIVVVALLAVSVLMTPSMLHLVAQRRFPDLERRHGGSWWRGALGSLLATLLALLAMLASIPLWLVPPLVLVLPPLIWGWLTYKVMSFDVLAEHASADERRQLMREQHWPLLAIGVITGYLGAAPSLLWAVSAVTLVFAPLLVVVSVWLNTLVFGFSALWFTHFALAALARLRGQAATADREPPRGGEVIDITPAAAPPGPQPTATTAAAGTSNESRIVLNAIGKSPWVPPIANLRVRAWAPLGQMITLSS